MSCNLEGKRGLYKNDLVGANGDYLALDSTIALSAGQEINFTFELPNNSVQRFLGAMDDASAYIVLQTDGSVFVQLLSGGITIPIGGTVIGLNTIKLRESSGTYYFSANEGTEYTLVSGTTFSMEQVSRRLSSARDLILYSFEANGESFPLNEARGAEFYGSNGSSGTRITSHAGGLPYINDTMIQRYGVERGERGSKLVLVNNDYLSMSTTYDLQDGQFIEIDFSFINFVGPIYPLGGTGSGPNLRILPTSVQLTGDGSTVSFSTSTSPGRHVFRFNRVGVNIELVVDGVTISTQGIGTNTSFPYNKLGKRDGVSSSDMDMNYVNFNGEVFNLNEHNGAAFYNQDGVIGGQRITSHSGGLNYINEEMIIKI